MCEDFQNGKAMYESKINNNGFLNLALSKENEYEICFEKTPDSKIMLTTVKPNLMCQFRIQNSGGNLPEKPFFYEKGLSTISVDNIFAVKMPRLEILSQDSPRWPDNCEFLEQRSLNSWLENC